MTDAEILAVAAVLVGGACHSATGFGFVLVAGPLVVAALPPEKAITSLLGLGIVTSALTLLTEARHPYPLWRESASILAWGAGGALAGAYLLAQLDATALQLLVTAAIIATLVARRLEHGSDPFRRLPVVGLTAGVLTTTTSANGPPILLYLLGRQVGPARMRDTLSVTFIGFALVGLAALAVGDPDVAPPDGIVAVVMLTAAAGGHVAGRPLFARLAAGRYDQVVTGLLIVSVVTGAIVALA
ncbi:MAG: sulfite exporter TauE/SafE family protein [Actinomycetota bacterium]|nr:sulfite exporter TauE/SafE family protein [Actinomycetota bacterium]